jgi:hypothetical protein
MVPFETMTVWSAVLACLADGSTTVTPTSAVVWPCAADVATAAMIKHSNDLRIRIGLRGGR